MAADWLVTQGFHIVGMNVRFGALEIDVLARRGPLLVVVEVRTRGAASWQTAFASVTGPKLRRLRKAAERVWLASKHDVTLERVRIDVIAVHLDESPVRVEVAEAVA